MWGIFSVVAEWIFLRAQNVQVCLCYACLQYVHVVRCGVRVISSLGAEIELS